MQGMLIRIIFLVGSIKRMRWNYYYPVWLKHQIFKFKGAYLSITDTKRLVSGLIQVVGGGRKEQIEFF